MLRSCLLLAIAFAGGCHLAFPIEEQADAGSNAAGPKVFSAPGPAAMLFGGYPKAFTITLAADTPGTTIYYTTDGSMPDTSSQSAVTPVTGITISANTMVRFFGVDDGEQGAVTSEMYSIDAASAQGNAGYLVTNVTLDGTSPVVVAAPGAMLAGRASVQTWVQGACPACAGQVVFGVDKTDQGCLYDGGPGVYPGVTTTAKTFDVRAPMEAGVHEVRLAHIEQTSCANAMAQRALATRPTLARIGVIIVR
jgi:hypothetical protein